MKDLQSVPAAWENDSLCLHQLFKIQAEQAPNNIALVDGDVSMTYRELDRLTDALAGYLQQQGVTFDKIVGIFLEKCSEYVIACVAALKAGGAFMSLELAYPDVLLTKILDEAKPNVVITKSCYSERLAADPSTVILNIDVDSNWLDYTYDLEAVSSISQDNLAIVGYSSGTTGEPKGVLVPHRAVVYAYCKHWETIGSGRAADRFAYITFMTWEVFRPLVTGITGYVVPDNISYDPGPLLDFMATHEINHTIITPSLLQAIINRLDPNEIQSKLSSLEVLWLAGEILTTKLIDSTSNILPPNTLLLNAYGPTECFFVSVADLKATEEPALGLQKGQTSELCSVGPPLKEMDVLLLDEAMEAVSVGETGELYVTGPCLAQGYLNQPDLTAEHFVVVNGGRFYRTGDLAVILPDGSLLIKGRRDFTVKIRSYRVNLGAIETALLENAQVKSCVVIAEGEEGENKRLVAYVIRQRYADWKINPADGTCVALRNRLKPYLAHYMIPSVYVELDAIPINPASGKVNRKILPSPPRRNADDLREVQLAVGASRKEQEAVMGILLEHVLFLDRGTINRHSDFFDFGLHSLLAVELTDSIEKVFHATLRVNDVYEHPTVKELVEYINADFTNPNEVIGISPVASMREDAYLAPAITLPSTSKPLSLRDAKSILLTGATGFLGSCLLDELLRATRDDTKIYCLVRAESGSQADGYQRIINTLKQYHLWNQETEERIIPVVGDLTKKYLGLSTESFNGYAEKIDLIFHCAALVNLVYSYSVLKPATVSGTHEILRFAFTSVSKPLHYISTLGIFPPGDSGDRYLENSDIDSFADGLIGGYSQTKWVAEKLVWEAISRDLPVCIYRPGTIGPHSVTGVTNPNDFLFLIIDACRKVQCAPQNSGWMFEGTPVDFLAKAIVRFASDPTPHLGQVYNVVQTDRTPATTVFHLLEEQNYISDYVSVEGWKSRLYSKAKEDDDVILNVLAQSLEVEERHLTYKSIYDCSLFEKAVSTYGLKRPVTDANYLIKGLSTKNCPA